MSKPDTESQNGTQPAAPAKITIEWADINSPVAIDVKCPNLDVALSMLATAKRELEALWRRNKQAQINAEVQRAMQDASIAAQLRKSVSQ